MFNIPTMTDPVKEQLWLMGRKCNILMKVAEVQDLPWAKAPT